ncbi:MAG TPA: universal stress protein [Kofleriaceae bacterium]|jgi:nucleotide-binding universal stress UspA family protein
MTTKPIQVVVGFNFSNSAGSALRYAIDLARHSAGRVFHFACIIDPHSGVPNVPIDRKVDYVYAEKVQQALTARIEHELGGDPAAETIHFFVHARIGDPEKEILRLAEGVGADLIVVGCVGLTGVERIVLGSVAETIVRSAGCAVMVARPKTYADVELLPVVEVAPSHHYVPPHRYSYEDARIIERPPDWPLY